MKMPKLKFLVEYVIHGINKSAKFSNEKQAKAFTKLQRSNGYISKLFNLTTRGNKGKEIKLRK